MTTGNHPIKIALLISVVFLYTQIHAQDIQPPSLQVSVYGQLVSITWSESESAHSYRFYYAPFPDAEVVSDVVLGPVTSLFAMLPVLSAYFIAVAAITDNGEGEISNIESFTVLQEQIDSNIEVSNSGDWLTLTLNDRWQWQLLGSVNTEYDVAVYDIDLFNVSVNSINDLQASGRKVICYFSAGSYEDFREDAGLFPDEVLGSTLDGFADERWLDIRSPIVQQIVLVRLDIAKAKGCDGVEPDNMDGYANATGFDLNADDQLAFNRFVANEAHARGLAVALKNDLEQIPDLVAYFDFAVNEQCHEFNECEELVPFIAAGKPVYNAEYAAVYVNDVNQRNSMCEDSINLGLDTLILPLELDDSFRFSCQ